MMRLRMKPAEKRRFLAKVRAHAPLRCWIWRAARTKDGYGVMRIAGRLAYAHRLAYAMAYGSPGRRIVRHRCDNPRCVNPMHLKAGTQRDNVHDMIAKGRAAWQR